MLISSGADASVSNNKQQTPLHLAVLNSCSDTMLSALLKGGADPNTMDLEVSPSAHPTQVSMRSPHCDH